MAVAKQWMWELYLQLGGTIPALLNISVPGLGARIQIPLADYRTLSAQDIIAASMLQLQRVREWSQVLQEASSAGREVKLAWRRGDVLDWIDASEEWSVVVGYALSQVRHFHVLSLP